MRKPISVDQLKEELIKGDIVALSRGITLLESQKSSFRKLGEQLLHDVMPYANKSYRIGISGVPGAGKSTFINTFGTYLCEKGYKVAVLAVDPSSTISGGSILGDKLRMQTLSQHPNSFIRPSPTSGTLGGVNRSTRESILLCEAAGFDIIIVETVGVGQVETIVRDMVDFFLLVALTGAGDEIQGIKRGILELVDGILINKADGDNKIAAQETAQLYRSMMTLFPPITEGWSPRVLTCSSLYSEGMDETLQMIIEFFNGAVSLEKRRLMQNLHWFESTLERMIVDRVLSLEEMKGTVAQLKEDIQTNEKSVFQSVEQFSTLLDNVLTSK
ncbi:MAG: methylmalonyl Co-A mutase-associated GTPase MeaB [Bacillaceae bacterium]